MTAPKKSDLMRKQGYHEPRRCGDCTHMQARERACGSQSFYTERTCTKGSFGVSKNGTCNEWKERR